MLGLLLNSNYFYKNIDCQKKNLFHTNSEENDKVCTIFNEGMFNIFYRVKKYYFQNHERYYLKIFIFDYIINKKF